MPGPPVNQRNFPLTVGWTVYGPGGADIGSPRSQSRQLGIYLPFYPRIMKVRITTSSQTGSQIAAIGNCPGG